MPLLFDGKNMGLDLKPHIFGTKISHAFTVPFRKTRGMIFLRFGWGAQTVGGSHIPDQGVGAGEFQSMVHNP